MGPITIKCPGCGELLPVPSRVVVDLPHTSTVLVRMDSTAARAHFAECQAKTPEQPAPAPVHQPGLMDPRRPATTVAQAHQARPLPAFIAPGTRACTGCGTSQADCLAKLQQGRKAGPSRTGKHLANACCGMCHDGNTHPVPGAQLDCQVWAAEHGPRADG